MKAWLAHPQRAYWVYPFAITVAGEEMWPPVSPVQAIEAGDSDSVEVAATPFAEASEHERFISLTFLCTLDAVRRLTDGDWERTAQTVEIARLLLNRLRKDTVVNEVLQMLLVARFGPHAADHGPTRLVDCMLDDRLPLVLDDLKHCRLDPVALLEEGDLDFYGW